MWYHPLWLTQALVEERNREAERDAALRRLYQEAGLGPLAGLEAAGRNLAFGLGGWLVAVGRRLGAAAQEPSLGPCCPDAG